MEKILDKAILFATNAHSGQKRKAHNYSYIVHPMEVVSIIASLTEDEEIMAAGVLHDVIEDCDVKIEEIEKLFGKRVAQIVSDESEVRFSGEDKKQSWKRRKQATIDHISKAEYESKIVCLADKLSNIRTVYADYTKVGQKVFDRFNNNNSDDHKWYYENLKNSLASLSDTVAYKEFCELIDKVFN